MLDSNSQLSLSIELFRSGSLTLVKASKMAGMNIEDYLATLGKLNIAVTDQSKEELESDLQNIL